MRKFLLTFVAAVIVSVTTQAQVTFQWGSAEWNIENGRTYENINEFLADLPILTYENPAEYTFTMFTILAISYDVYVDNATEAIQAYSSARQGTAIALSYDFIEGHNYRIEVQEAILAIVNIVTYTADTVSTNNDKYSISFRINGPEIVNEYNYEASMSLAIFDQEAELTYSELDLASICTDLGINDITEAQLIGLNTNGSYNKAFTSPDYGYDFFDGWRDADGEYTVWGGGAGGGAYNLVGGHNPYPAVYCIKFNETCDTIKYYFYDYWIVYDPEEPGEIPATGGGVKRHAPLKAPETHYNSVIIDREDSDGTTKQYRRNFRVDPGSDYKANFILKTEEKAVLIHATMHFVSSEYDPDSVNGFADNSLEGKCIVYGIDGARKSGLTKGINLLVYPNGQTRKLYVR